MIAHPRKRDVATRMGQRSLLVVRGKRYSLVKYSGALWAKDQTLLHFSDAKPFVEWLEPPADESKVDIEGDDDEAS